MPNKVLGVTNWKTALCGFLIATAEMLPQHFPGLQPYTDIAIPLLTVLLGLVAKDGNVTGGTIPQTAEAEVRVAAPEVITEATAPLPHPRSGL